MHLSVTAVDAVDALVEPLSIVVVKSIRIFCLWVLHMFSRNPTENQFSLGSNHADKIVLKCISCAWGW